MKSVACLVLLGALTSSAWAQSALTTGAANGRGGGISFVTRRLPTSGVGVQANNFFAAGGVPTAAATTGSGTVVAAAPAVASAAAPKTSAPDQRAMTALRQLAAQGNKDAKALLGELQTPSAAAARR